MAAMKTILEERAMARSIILGALFAFLLFHTPVEAGTLSVTPAGDGDAATIQEAIDAAADGDSVLLGPGTYTGEGNRDLELRGKAITILGTGGPAATILDCKGVEGDPHRGLFVHEREGPQTSIRGITITNGYVEGRLPASYGGAILCIHSSPTILDCWIIGNRSSHFGGGMVCYRSASPTLRRVRFIDNQAVNNGGGFGSKKKSSPRIEDSIFIRNSAKRGGALWCWDAGIFLNRSTLYANDGPISTGGIWSSQAKIKVRNSIIAGSTGGKALACTDPPPEMRVKNCNIFGNAGGDEIPPCAINEGGNFSADPLFADPEHDDFSLRPESPCAPGNHPDGLEVGWIGAPPDSVSGE